jgi:hypothetical protein
MTLPTISDIQAVDPVLTNMLIAYVQSDERYIADKVFGGVSVDKDSGTYYILDKKYWMLENMQVRAPGEKFRRAGFGVSTATYETLQYALEHPIPDEHRANNQMPMALERVALQWLAGKVLLNREVKFATDFMTTGVWETDNTTATDWDDYGTSDPVGDMRTAKRTISQSTGVKPNFAAMGEIVEDALVNHPDLLDRIKYTQVANIDNMRAAMASVFGLENIWVSEAIQNTANEGQDASMAAVIDDDCLVGFANPAPDMMNASLGKTFYWNPGGGLGGVRQYRDESADSNILKEKQQYDQKATATDLGYFFSDIV